MTGQVDPSSLGGDFADTDGANDTLAGADDLVLGPGDTAVAVNRLVQVAGGDVDFYRVPLQAGDVFIAMTAPLDSFYDLDTVLVVLDSNGDFLFDDDDATDSGADVGPGFDPVNGPDSGFGSALQFLAPETGDYYLAVTGFDPALDDNIVPHTEVGDYALLVARVPEPSPALLAMMTLTAAMRRCRP